MWWQIVIGVVVLGLLLGIGIVYNDIYNYQVLQRKLRKEKALKNSESMKKGEK